MGYIDKNGFIYITGRKNDMIVLRNGKNVYPQEIENLINELPYVEESMVYSREQNNTDTTLVAKIVYNKEYMSRKYKQDEYEKIIWEDIKKMNLNLPIYKHIKKIIISDIPLDKTRTQKIKRNQEIKKSEGK